MGVNNVNTFCLPSGINGEAITAPFVLKGEHGSTVDIHIMDHASH